MVLYLLFYSVLLAVTYCDLRYRRIPDKYVIALFFLGMISLISFKVPSLASRLYGLLLTPLIPIFCNFFRRKAFGGGDIKLLAGCGWFLGVRIAIVGLAISIICCGVYCIAGLIITRLNKKTVFPFGPFICMGMILANLYGEGLLIWFFN